MGYVKCFHLSINEIFNEILWKIWTSSCWWRTRNNNGIQSKWKWWKLAVLWMYNYHMHACDIIKPRYNSTFKSKWIVMKTFHLKTLCNAKHFLLQRTILKPCAISLRWRVELIKDIALRYSLYCTKANLTTKTNFRDCWIWSSSIKYATKCCVSVRKLLATT